MYQYLFSSTRVIVMLLWYGGKNWLFCWNSWKNKDIWANKSLIIHKTSQNNRNNIILLCIWVKSHAGLIATGTTSQWMRILKMSTDWHGVLYAVVWRPPISLSNESDLGQVAYNHEYTQIYIKISSFKSDIYKVLVRHSFHHNRIDGVMVMLASSAVDCGFKPWSGQAKDY
jgi:hypothetical protein